jgi:hypothetical protein
MVTKHSKKLDTAIYKKFQEIYLLLLRFYLKEKIIKEITKEREGEIDKIVLELNNSLQMVEEWYKKS